MSGNKMTQEEIMKDIKSIQRMVAEIHEDTQYMKEFMQKYKIPNIAVNGKQVDMQERIPEIGTGGQPIKETEAMKTGNPQKKHSEIAPRM